MTDVLAVAGNFMRNLRLSSRRGRMDAQAASLGLPSTPIADYGRRLGRRLVLRGDWSGYQYMVHPLDTVRHWEFDWVVSNLPDVCDSVLDVSSPRLLAFYLADTGRVGSVLATNPDAADLRDTERIARSLGIGAVHTQAGYASDVAKLGMTFDCVWCVSVLEHIGGDGDASAVETLLGAVRPGGRLIITVPIDRVHRDEFLDEDPYGLSSAEQGPFFFQRFYTAETLRSRLLANVAPRSVEFGWYGERTPGAYQSWLATRDLDPDALVREPVWTAENFSVFSAYEEMPGMGIAGLVLTK